MVSQLGGDRRIRLHIARKGVDGCSDRGVQRQPLAGQKLVVDCLPQEVVAELHDLVVARQQQLTVDCLPQRCGDVGLLHPRHRRQDVVSCGLTRHGDHA